MNRERWEGGRTGLGVGSSARAPVCRPAIALAVLAALTWTLAVRAVRAHEPHAAQPPAAETARPAGPVTIRTLVSRGNARTRDSTIRGLLPVPLPAMLTARQIDELERRLKNLGIFDDVRVDVVTDALVVSVREKFTITPSLGLSTGTTLEDTYVSLGATEYNFLGTASELGVEASYSDRRPNGDIWFAEHPFRAGRPGFIAGAFFSSASLRFDSPDASWFRDQLGVWAGARLPYSYRLPLRIEVSASTYAEWISARDGASRDRVPGGQAFANRLEATWDRYTWDDLVPSGWRISAEGTTGMLLPRGESARPKARHRLETRATFALPLGESVVIAGRGEATVHTLGDANHTDTLGSVEGVRGLADAFYRNHIQAFANLEARWAIRFARRWALQPVAFLDGAAFLRVDAAGTPTSWQSAAAFGAGARLVPTFLTNLLLRVDAAHLVRGDHPVFVQLGATQYF